MSSPSDAPPAVTADELDYAYFQRVSTRVAAQSAIDTLLSLTHTAFDACVTTFTTNVITQSERACIEKVTKKYVASAVRVSRRFAELQESAATASAEAATARRVDAEKRLEAGKQMSPAVVPAPAAAASLAADAASSTSGPAPR